MKTIQYIDGTNEENALAQQYYDLAVTIIRPKIKKYLNVNVSRRVLNRRISKCRKYYKKLSEIQYKISQIPRNRNLRYTKVGDTKPIKYKVEAIDTQARSWINRLSTAITFMVIKQSEYDVKSSIRRDIIICIVSIFLSILSGAFISWYFAK